MKHNFETIFKDPVARLEALLRNGPECDAEQTPESHMYELASQGEIDLHVVEIGEDGCRATVYTMPGEQPVLECDQAYCGRLTAEDAQQRLEELQALSTGQLQTTIVE